jgi:MinD superfamily P-loop ATPase
MTVLAVASGKGGTGKSCIASSLALAAGQVVAVDADVEEPNLGKLLGMAPKEIYSVSLPMPVFDEKLCKRCGLCAKECRFNALVQFGDLLPRLNEGLCHGCGVCSMVCPHGAITEGSHVIGKVSRDQAGDLTFLEGRLDVGCPNPVPVIKSVIDTAKEEGDLIIVDSPPGTACSMVEATEQADYVLLVTEGTPFGMADLKLALEVVSDLKRPAGVVANRSDLGGSDPEEICRSHDVPVLARIPFSRQVAQVYGLGESPYRGSPLWREQMDRLWDSVKKEARL